MKSIRNTTHTPLRVPLPQGKTVHLGPNQVGQIAVHAVDHPPLVKMVEAGQIEILGDGERSLPHANPAIGHAATHGHKADTSLHRRGDR